MLFSQVLRRSPQWKRAIAEAEKLVSYSGSYLSLQSSLSDEEANLALSVRKLLGTKHPLLKTAKNVFYNSDNSIQTRGLVVLLVSQAANDMKKSISGNVPSTSSGDDCTSNYDKILTSQRNLAEIAEIVYTANLLHRGVLDVAEMASAGNIDKLLLGNKLAVLGGDFLLANASVALANLQVPQVTSSIAQGIADMTEAQFVSSTHPRGPLPKELWERKVYLQSGSLLAHSCKSVILLADLKDKSALHASFTIGRSVAFIYALNQVLNTDGDANHKETPEIDLNRQETFDLLENHGKLAISSLSSSFPASSNAVRSLMQLIRALSDRKCLI